MGKVIVKAQIDDELKNDVEKTLNDLGLNISDVIRILFNQIRLHKAIPFEIKMHKMTEPTEEEIEIIGDKIMTKYGKAFKELAE
jgi:addiction module RelB/DinJ family antitoxin